MISLEDYNYELPPSLLANEPASPRDSSRLFIYNTQTDEINLDTFLHLDHYLPKNSFLVLNKTKVVPSRITVYKKTGGKVVALFLVNEPDENYVKCMFDRNVAMGQTIILDNKYELRVERFHDGVFYLSPRLDMDILLPILEKHGSMPIPPYLKKTKLKEDQLRTRYQTIFASEKGSVAAPTASLHFTNRVFKKLDKAGIERFWVKLHVGMGTFAYVDQHHIDEKKLHNEWYEVTKEQADEINQARTKGKELVAVGTTVVRTLESAAISGQHGYRLEPVTSSTDMFIYPPYEYKMVDHLITNFHVPKSSLMMLVDAFLQHKHAKRRILDLYTIAMKEGFRFYSFGDSMLIL